MQRSDHRIAYIGESEVVRHDTKGQTYTNYFITGEILHSCWVIWANRFIVSIIAILSVN